MIELTPVEIKAICSISNTDTLFGLPFNVKYEEDSGDLEKLIESLSKKGIISNTKLTDKGKVLVSLMEFYNKSKTHIFLNRTRIAVDKEGVTVFVKKENTLDVYRKHKVEFIEDIVMNYDFMKQAQKRTHFIKEPIIFDGDWMIEESKKYPYYLMIKKYKQKKETQHGYLCWNDEQAVYYNYYAKTIQQLGPRETRIFLLELFEVEMGEI